METGSNLNVDGKLETMGYEQSLKRVLSLRHLIFFGLAYLAPTVVFNYYGIVTEASHGMMTLGYIITTLAMFFTAYSYAQMVAAYPIAGSAYSYIQRSINPHVGFLAGWTMLLDYLLIPMICYLIVGMYMNRFLPIVPVWVWVVISVVIIGFINIIGIEPAAKVNTVIIIAQITFTLLFIAVIIKFVIGGGGTGTLLSWDSIFNAKEFSASGLFFASSVLCVSFLGFDAVTTVAEETINPEKTVGKAIMVVAVGAGVVFAIVSYFSQIAWPTAYMSFNDSGTGIFELLDRIKVSFMPTLFLVTDNFASLACALAGQAAVARILFGMGRDGALPKKFFGYVNPKFKTPVFNILITSAVALTAIFYSDNLMGAASLVSFGALTGFILVNLSVIFHYFIKGHKRTGLDIVRYLIIPVIGMGVCATLWIHLDTSAKILGGLWLLIGFIYTAITTNFFRKLPPDLKLEA